MEQINLSALHPRLIMSKSSNSGFSRILGSSQDSVTMRSGMVQLKPKEAVGIHSTKDNEELLIILEGEGEFMASGRKPEQVKGGDFYYCPPRTEHNVRNIGQSVLRYVYVVARAL